MAWAVAALVFSFSLRGLMVLLIFCDYVAAAAASHPRSLICGEGSRGWGVLA